MTGRMLLLPFGFLMGFSAFALSAGVKVFERRINEAEFQYNDGSARNRLLPRRSSRPVLTIPE